MPTDSPQTTEQALDYYRKQRDFQENEMNQIVQRWNLIGFARGILFLGSLACLILGFADAANFRIGFWVLSGILFAIFVGVAFYHEGLTRKLKVARLLSQMHAESVARIERKWDEIKVPQIEIPAAFAPISKDLDLLGRSSIYKLLGITRTPLGTETLRSWIIDGADADEIQKRQEAVAELKNEFQWRIRFRLSCEQLSSTRSGPSRFVQWCESPNWFANGRSWLLWLTRLTAATSLLSIVTLIFGLIPLTITGPTLVVTCALNFFLSLFYAGPIHDIFNQVSSRSDEAVHYVALFDLVADYPAKSAKLIGLQQRLKKSENSAQSSIQSLGLRSWLANIRRQGFLFIIYMVFEFLFFWDVHALDLLEKWKAKNGFRARGWFEDLGQWEALAALAKFAGDHPGWVFPEIKKVEDFTEPVIRAEKLGHPLLGTERVSNDVTVGPPGTVLLVTGSNMSGKSTLLRSIGINVVLGQMGSVVCAKSMKHPPLHVETSMRIDDSLADGISFFMAELKRLKEIVDTASDYAHDPQKRLLFLLDEILQGTNSRERQIAVSRVVRKLIDEAAIGAISTHDLDLAKTDELAEACKTVHFSEHFEEVNGKKQMTFDYQMKQGIAETTNALKLLEIVGLGDQEFPVK
ncbi:MAG: hypothetical protein AAF623_02125 [Planctomycetota bacterium]